MLRIGHRDEWNITSFESPSPRKTTIAKGIHAVMQETGLR